jgi:hypothetical protein
MISSPEPEPEPEPEGQSVVPVTPDGGLRGFVEVPWIEAEDLELPDPFVSPPGLTQTSDIADDAD